MSRPSNTRRGVVFQALLLAIVVGQPACESHDVEVELAQKERTFTSTERGAIQRIADAAARDVRVQLPMLPKRWKLVVETGKDVIPETGENGTTVPPAQIVWTVDPARDVLSVIQTQLRPTLFHELHHLARAGIVPTKSLVDAVVTEGLATAFERDFAKASPPWGDAPPEVEDWTRELLAQPDTARHDWWLIRHPDGRRWIGMRVGTFLVDRATKATGRSSAALVGASAREIVGAAQVR